MKILFPNYIHIYFSAPIDIQSILNGAAKFCRHCDVVILNSLIRRKVSDLPFLSKEEAEPGDELCFCSAACYMQFALMHRTPSNTQDKVYNKLFFISIINHKVITIYKLLFS